MAVSADNALIIQSDCSVLLEVGQSARTLATQSSMINQWLKEDQSLEPVKELWVKIHYPATAR